MAVVEAGTLGGRGDDRQRLDPFRPKLLAGNTELFDVPPAEGAVQPAHDRQQDRALAAIVGQRDDPLLVDGREREVRGWLARLERWSRFDGSHLLVLLASILGVVRTSRPGREA